MSQRNYQRRIPRQERSKARLETILKSAVEIIAEVGADALKMKDVAARAEISIGSLYQYFPDKSALIHALTERELSASRQLLEAALKKVRTLEDALVVIPELIDHHCARLRADSARRDIWYGMQADKVLQHMDIEDSRHIGKRLYSTLKPFIPPSNHSRLKHFLFLNAHLVGATARMAAALPPREGRAIIREFRAMMVNRLTELSRDS